MLQCFSHGPRCRRRRHGGSANLLLCKVRVYGSSGGWLAVVFVVVTEKQPTRALFHDGFAFNHPAADSPKTGGQVSGWLWGTPDRL